MAGRKKFNDATDGKIGMPSVGPGINKLPPAQRQGGKGAKSDKDDALLGQDKDEAKDEKILERARKRFDKAASAESENRKAELDDKKFLSGEGQWPMDVAAQRNFDRRPCLTINKLPTFVNQITNDQRQNRPAINVSPVGDRSDPEVAKMYRGLIRAIERDSTADIAYDTAFADAAGIGEGYWLVTTEYAAEDTFNQVVRIKRVRNRFTVYLDPDRQDPTAADAKWGFITTMVPRKDFEEKYPDADPMSFNQAGLGDKYSNWMTSDAVRVAEYYEITHEKRTLVRLSNDFEGWKDELGEDVLDDIKAGTIEIEREREARIPKVTWYKLTAVEILERTDWVGKWIPIVQVTGNEIDIEGKCKLSGVIRNAKQPQLMYNYMSTLEVELTALQPKAPYIMTAEQYEGHENAWKQANVSAQAVLLYNSVTLANGTPVPPPARQIFQSAPGGVVQAAQKAAQDMMATTGIRFDATLQERTVDESGRALREIRRTGDLGSFHYVDNLSRSLKRCGEILIDLIPKIYDTKQIVTILREDNTEEMVQIDPKAPKSYTEMRYPAEHPVKPNKVLKIFNPTIGKYGVTVTIGPSYATKRIEASESMMDFIRVMPPDKAGAVIDLVAKNQDWPGGEEFANRLTKLVAQQYPGIMTADVKDVPPQFVAMLQGLDTQVKALTAERVQMMKALNDQNADRAIEVKKIDQDYETKLLKIVADLESKSAATQEKAIANFNTHIGSRLMELGEGVKALQETLTPSVQQAE